MSIRRSSTSESLPVQALRADAAAPLPHINQLRPKGAASSHYVNGPYNCAPAVVAMVARSWGKQGHLNDAQLINSLGKGVVTSKGTTPEGVAQMLGRIGVPLAGEALAGQYSDAALKQHLQQGNTLIAQVGVNDRATGQDSAHYVLIHKATADGNYVVSDPMANKPYVISPKQLREAVGRAPPDGGLLIPVGGPGNASAAATASSLASGQPVPAETARTDAFVGASRTSRGTAEMPLPSLLPTAPAARGEGATVLPSRAGAESLLQGLNTATLASTTGAFAGSPAASVPLEAPVPAAFSVPDNALEGIDTRFHEAAAAGPALPLSTAEQHNLASLDIRYGQESVQAAPVKEQITSQEQNVEQISRELLSRKERKDPELTRLLARLESSLFSKDRQVLNRIKREDLRDPGIGKKTWIDSF
ncbi:Peptidase_C39 like family protein [Stigmatella aurantiaca]|uniref:Peptidase_C39 like family protein n=1 Tax=Stigmatella aurantiaca TaxID=41 RepID=A0A1H7FX40_STIAU|nr:C39 family peptidase [Stigmatella aurantiaca]SEK30498.1 Peptidase_C39 like family protein [Stigmatella aurantiaca]